MQRYPFPGAHSTAKAVVTSSDESPAQGDGKHHNLRILITLFALARDRRRKQESLALRSGQTRRDDVDVVSADIELHGGIDRSGKLSQCGGGGHRFLRKRL